MNKLGLIIEEVKNLKNNIKKKYTLLRDNIQLLQNDIEGQKVYVQQNRAFVFPIDCLQRILIIIGDIKKSKVNILILGFVQNLLTLQIINTSIHSQILDYLLKIQEVNNDALQIKLQQTFCILVSQTTLTVTNLEFLEKVFTMLILMKSSKNPLIANTSISSLNQIMSNIIKESTIKTNQQQSTAEENCSPERKEVSSYNNSSPLKRENGVKIINLSITAQEEKVRFLAQVLYDFVMLADDQKCQWWPKTIPVDKELGFNILFQSLLEIGQNVQTYKEIQSVFRFNFFPIIKKSLTNNSNTNIQILNLIRGLTKTITIFNDEFEVLETLVQLALGKELTQVKYWSFEGLIFVVSEYETLYQMFCAYNFKKQPNNTFMQILQCAVKVVQQINQQQNEQGMQRVIQSQQINMKTAKAIETNDQDIEFPQITSFLQIKQAIDFFLKLSNSLEIICRNKLGFELGQKIQENNRTSQYEGFKSIFDLIWKEVYSSVKILLAQTVDESLFQNILNIIQTFTNISGTISNRTASDQFIKAICNYSLPKDSDMTPRNIQTNKMVLNIAHCLGNLLEMNSWIYILVFLQKSESLYNKNRIARDNTQEELSKLTDIQTLQNTLDYLFENSQNYENNHLLTLLNSLFELIVDQISDEKNGISLSNSSSTSKKNDASTNVKSKQSIFSLQKLLETLKVNLYRIDLMWETVSANFLSIATTRNQFFREKAVETLGDFVLESFQYLEDEYQENSTTTYVRKVDVKQPTFKDKEKWTKENWQFTLFQPWIDIQCHSESKDIIMNNILKILQNNGHVINQSGWSQILDILKGISTDSSQNYIFTGIKCIELLVNQYLSNLHHSKLSTLLMIIENFKKYSNDNNINYLSCDMLWHIGDHIAKKQTSVLSSTDSQFISKEEFGLLITSILEKLLSLCVDPHAEARNSAQHIFSQLIVHNFSKLSAQSSVQILENMVWNMGESVITNLKQEIRSGSDKIKQWEETASNTCQHLTKITKRYINILDKKETLNQGSTIMEDSDAMSYNIQKSFQNFQKVLILEQQESLYDSENQSEYQELSALNQKSIVSLIEKCSSLLLKFLEINLNDLNKESIKCMRDLYGLKPLQTLQNNQTFLNIIAYLQSFFQTVPPQVKNVKSIFQQFQPEVLGWIDDFIQTKFTNDEDKKLQDSQMANVFELFYLIILYPKLVNDEHELQTNKIFPDEKYYIEILQRCMQIMQETSILEEEYINLIRKIINLPLNSLLIDNIQKKIIPLMIQQIKKETNFEKPYIYQFVLSIQTTIFTKNNIKYMELTQQNCFSSKNKPIWMTSTECLQDLSLFLIQKEPQFIHKLYQILCEYFIQNKFDIVNLIKYYNSDMLKEYFECERILLDLIISKFLPLPCISKQNLRLFGYVLYQNSQFKIESEQSQTQYNLDDLGINFSKNCLNLLFKAAQADKNKENQEKAVLFLPFLLNRCRLTLEQFLQEQKYMVGSVYYKVTKIKDIDYILQMLKNLEINTNSFHNIQMQEDQKGIDLPYDIQNNVESQALNSEYGHLIYLFPLIKQCMTSHQSQFESSINVIFLKIYQVLGVSQYY
ncbi:hypothetical protein ABPG72_001245 [Tetrahymena utriculariae]